MRGPWAPSTRTLTRRRSWSNGSSATRGSADRWPAAAGGVPQRHVERVAADAPPPSTDASLASSPQQERLGLGCAVRPAQR